ncbi:hypothetical protein B0A53_06450 [Rhodotorula sp. CCFEE 5036]|nr:hypothetical protein B0A53_06450 [Rhodotorula sp. CCFEE 5036]
MLGTRPDLCYAVGVPGRHAAGPDNLYWAAVIRVLVYIKGTLDFGLEFQRDDSPLAGFEAYSDSDWGACPSTSRSRSTMEKPASSHPAPPGKPIELFGDCQGANALSGEEHLVREQVQQGDITVTYIPTARMVASVMTKSLPLHAFLQHRLALGIRPFQARGVLL